MAGTAAVLLAGALLAGCGGQSDAANVNRRTAARGDTAAPPAPAAPESRNLLFIGTSLTAGLGLDPENAFPNLIAERVDSAGLPYRVTNAGISGETTAALVRRLDWLLEGEFDVVVVETGANDGLRGIPVGTARENIEEILARIRARRPDAAIILVQMESPPNLGRAYTDAFREMYAELAAKHDVVLMPFLLEGVAGEAALNQGDGIHPNEKGAEKVADNVWRVLRPVLEQRALPGG
jgi:acyl-CoA thioesterase-1